MCQRKGVCVCVRVLLFVWLEGKNQFFGIHGKEAAWWDCSCVEEGNPSVCSTLVSKQSLSPSFYREGETKVPVCSDSSAAVSCFRQFDLKSHGFLAAIWTAVLTVAALLNTSVELLAGEQQRHRNTFECKCFHVRRLIRLLTPHCLFALTSNLQAHKLCTGCVLI